MPAKATMVVTADARVQEAAGAGSTVGRRAHTVRYKQGKTARTKRLEREVIETTGLTIDDQYGTIEHGHVHNRWEFQANPIHGGGAPMGWSGLWTRGPNGVPD